MFEHHAQPLISRKAFISRMWRFAGTAFLLIVISWLIGILGYHILEDMAWIDSILNAAMILGGMGPVGDLHTDIGKLFASFYALFSGIVFLVSFGILLAPVIHRLMHQFHLQSNKDT